MMASIKTKRAVVELVAIKPINNKLDKIRYREIDRFKEQLELAKIANDKGSVDVYRKEIQRHRAQLRQLREQIYVFDVFVKQYNSLHRIEVLFDHSRGRKKFMKVIESAIGQAIHNARQLLKVSVTVTGFGKKWFYARHGSKAKGFVFADEGCVLKTHVQKNMQALLSNKTPVMPRRYVGIELEFCAPIKEEHLAVKLFQNGIQKFAQLKQDGSLRPKEKENSFELALLLEETTYKQGLKKVCRLLNEIKAVTKERRCGLHVHIDMRRRDKDLVYNNLVACQYALLSVVDPSRYNNEFCRVVGTRKFPTEFTGDRIERYKTINAAAYYKYKTLEVRMHEGSVSFDEISHWVDLLLKVANYSKFLKNDVTKLPVLKARLKLKEKLYNYALERSCSWQVQNNPNARNMREDVADLLARRPARAPNHLDQHVQNQIDRVFGFQLGQPQPGPLPILDEQPALGGANAVFRGIAAHNIEFAVPAPQENVDFDPGFGEDEEEF